MKFSSVFIIRYVKMSKCCYPEQGVVLFNDEETPNIDFDFDSECFEMMRYARLNAESGLTLFLNGEDFTDVHAYLYMSDFTVVKGSVAAVHIELIDYEYDLRYSYVLTFELSPIPTKEEGVWKLPCSEIYYRNWCKCANVLSDEDRARIKNIMANRIRIFKYTFKKMIKNCKTFNSDLDNFDNVIRIMKNFNSENHVLFSIALLKKFVFLYIHTCNVRTIMLEECECDMNEKDLCSCKHLGNRRWYKLE